MKKWKKMKINPSIPVLLALLLAANVIFIYHLRSVAMGSAEQEIDFDYMGKLRESGRQMATDPDFNEMKARYGKIKDRIKDERAKKFLDNFFREH